MTGGLGPLLSGNNDDDRNQALDAKIANTGITPPRTSTPYKSFTQILSTNAATTNAEFEKNKKKYHCRMREVTPLIT